MSSLESRGPKNMKIVSSLENFTTGWCFLPQFQLYYDVDHDKVLGYGTWMSGGDV